MLALKWEANARSRELLRTKIGEYMDRAEKIGQLIGVNKPVPAPARNPAPPASEFTAESYAPNIKWADVVGLEDAKSLLLEAAVFPIKFPQLFSGPRQPTTRILLYGPSGSGKRSLALALGYEVKAALFHVNAGDLGQGRR